MFIGTIIHLESVVADIEFVHDLNGDGLEEASLGDLSNVTRSCFTADTCRTEQIRVVRCIAEEDILCIVIVTAAWDRYVFWEEDVADLLLLVEEGKTCRGITVG